MPPPVFGSNLTRRGWALVARVVQTRRRRILLVGFVVLAICVASFLRLLDDVLELDGITGFDRHVNGYVAAHRHGGVTMLFMAITVIGGPQVLALIVGAAGAILALRTRSLRPIVIATVTYGGARLFVYLLKNFVDRERPPSARAVLSEDGYSFPSGHATGALVTFGIIAFLVGSTTSRRSRRVAVWVVAAITTVAVSGSRVYLGVHYPSDVLAAWAVGISWLTIVIVAVSAGPWSHPLAAAGVTPTRRERRHDRSPSQATPSDRSGARRESFQRSTWCPVLTAVLAERQLPRLVGKAEYWRAVAASQMRFRFPPAYRRCLC